MPMSQNHFGIDDHLLESMYAAGHRFLVSTGEHGFRLRERMGSDLVVQGNLDPSLVLAGMNVVLDGEQEVLAQWSSRPHLQPRARCPARY